MTRAPAEKIVRQLFNLANVEINGKRPWDIQVNDKRFFETVLNKRVLGFGESYMAGWWECEQIDTCVFNLLKANLEKNLTFNTREWLQILAHKLFNFQNKKRAVIVAKKHYDFGNDLFEYMLDVNMVYSCGYWKTATDLNQAQIDKLDLVCKKLHLASGMKLLDIGCGWGSLAKYAAENYGVEVVGITISKEQADLAKIRCKDLPVKIILKDYREINEKFDRIASIGMFEHVGYKNYRSFMEVVERCLASEGLILLHTMGSNNTVFNNNEWLEKYIFPNGMLPSIKQLGASFENRLTMEDWHNFGIYYYPTLISWHDNFNNHWDLLKQRYNETFKRMWNFYLLSCAGSALARGFQVWQIVLSKENQGNYTSLR